MRTRFLADGEHRRSVCIDKGVDQADRVVLIGFQAHGADSVGSVVFRKRFTQARLLEFFAASHNVWLPWKRVPGLTTERGSSAS